MSKPVSPQVITGNDSCEGPPMTLTVMRFRGFRRTG